MYKIKRFNEDDNKKSSNKAAKILGSAAALIGAGSAGAGISGHKNLKDSKWIVNNEKMIDAMKAQGFDFIEPDMIEPDPIKGTRAVTQKELNLRKAEKLEKLGKKKGKLALGLGLGAAALGTSAGAAYLANKKKNKN